MLEDFVMILLFFVSTYMLGLSYYLVGGYWWAERENLRRAREVGGEALLRGLALDARIVELEDELADARAEMRRVSCELAREAWMSNELENQRYV